MRKRARQLLAEGRLHNPKEAEIAAILGELFDKDLAIEVARECGNLKTARQYLRRVMSIINKNAENQVITH